MKKRILVVCGSGIATSTVVAGKVRDLLSKNGIECEVTQTSALELKGRLEGVDLIVSTTKLTSQSVPVVNAVPFLTGIGVDQAENAILAALRGQP